MVSNVNNNNNNNNINDNEQNANDDNINESNTNANVMSMVMVGLGGRKLNVTKRSIQVSEVPENIYSGQHKNVEYSRLYGKVGYVRCALMYGKCRLLR